MSSSNIVEMPNQTRSESSFVEVELGALSSSQEFVDRLVKKGLCFVHRVVRPIILSIPVSRTLRREPVKIISAMELGAPFWQIDSVYGLRQIIKERQYHTIPMEVGLALVAQRILPYAGEVWVIVSHRPFLRTEDMLVVWMGDGRPYISTMQPPFGMVRHSDLKFVVGTGP